MKLTLIQRKASSFKELGKEIIEINPVSTLEELLLEITKIELNKLQQTKLYLSENEIKVASNTGKIAFSYGYNTKQDSLEKAMQTAIQDFNDGLFRVFLNNEECLQLNKVLPFKEENEVVFIKLVMLAGRLW